MAANKSYDNVDVNDIPPYNPDDDEKKILKSVAEKYDRWTRDRKPYEQQWFINAAYVRGQQYVVWSEKDQRLVIPPAPAHRVRLVANRILPKVRAREAKFLKNRPIPVVVPGNNTLRDKQNARLTQKALEYAWRRFQLEQKFHDALKWSMIAHRAYWWFYWDEHALARVKVQSQQGEDAAVEDALLGDICIEVGSPFEVLVADPAIYTMRDQPEIMRIKIRSLEEVRARYPNGQFVHPETTYDSALRFERQISTLNSLNIGGYGLLEDRNKSREGTPTHVMVRELFVKPTPDFPKGRYMVVANGVLLKNQEELPYGLWQLPNPYPCVDFIDISQVGQFFGTTMVEQLIILQKEYNLIRSKIAEQLRVMAFPKLLIARQHQIPDGAWTSEAGEVISYLALPNLPEPKPWVPPNIAADAWRNLDRLKEEFDEISHIYPASEGQVGSATSGFQTNLLQEAADSVHAPDIRNNEMSIEEAAIKIRHMMKQFYNIPRLMSISGKDLQPEVFEFSSDNIDEYADIIVQAGSALPSLKGAKIQAAMELFKVGLYGNPADPEVRRRVLTQLEMATTDETIDLARQDEEAARLENDDFEKGEQVPDPEFFQQHDIHYRVHTGWLKEPQNASSPAKPAMIRHVINTVGFMNPSAALQLAQQYGQQDLVAKLQPMAAAQQAQAAGPVGPGPEGAPPTPGGGAPPAGPQGPAGPPPSPNHQIPQGPAHQATPPGVAPQQMASPSATLTPGRTGAPR